MGTDRGRNLALVAILFTLTLFAAYHEGYLPLISIWFWSLLGSGFLLAVWLAWSASTPRVLSLIFSIFMIEYVKESIGIASGLWVYHGIQGHYNFGVWGWVVGGVSVYTLSGKVVPRLTKRIRFTAPSWWNALLVLALSLLMVATLGAYRAGTGLRFYLFYAAVLTVCLYGSSRLEFRRFAGIVVTAWLAGYLSEYVGSVDSGIWTYPHDPSSPPVYLVFGCWPLEITAQITVSSFLANEPLDG